MLLAVDDRNAADAILLDQLDRRFPALADHRGGGATQSGHLFFWQASEEVEDMQATQGAAPLVRDSLAADAELSRIRWDTWSGMFYSDMAYFIILATAVTLNVAGITDIDTAAQALEHS